MSYPTTTNTTSQWTPAGPPLALPAALPYRPYYHLDYFDMGRKKKGPQRPPLPIDSYRPTQAADCHRPPEQHVYQSHRPTDDRVQAAYPRADSWRPPPDHWRPQQPPQGFSASLPSRPQPPSRRPNVPSREPVPSDSTALPNVAPRRILNNYNPPTQQANHFRPEAPAFQPGQSRYSLRSGQQRLYSTAAAEQILQSIESENVQSAPKFAVHNTRSRKPTPRREPTPINTTVTPVPVPQPSAAYIKHAQESSKKLEQSHKLLVLLDLNGTLVYRHGYQRQFSVKRPGVDRLLEYLFEHHTVMIFTSATIRSAKKMAHELLTPQQYGQLVTIQAREHLGLTLEQFSNKVQVYKDLNKIWTVKEVQQSAAELGATWDMTNTVLIDDSVEKARSHPHNLLQVPEFMHPASTSKKAQHQWSQAETDIMLGVEAELEVLKYRSSVARQIRQWQEGESISPGVTREKVDNGKLEPIKEGSAQAEKVSVEIEEPASYPTPTSLRRDSSTADEDDLEQLHGVKLPTPLEEASASVEGNIVPRERERKAREAEATRAMKSQSQSQSPITEADFMWRSEGNRAAADW